MITVLDEDERAVELAEMFADVARSLAAQPDVEATLANTVQLAASNLQACEFAGVSQVKGHTVTTAIATSDHVLALDSLVSDLQEGPCFDAIREHTVLQTGDLGNDPRWPSFGPRACETAGIKSMVSFRLFDDRITIGVLNLYSSLTDAFDDVDVALGAVFSAHASVGISNARLEENLERKAMSRELIGRAKGILMARSDVTEQEAFDLLRRASQRLNMKLVDVAADVVKPHPLIERSE